jgi:carboxypeptidase C (cathepsin A)
VFVVYVYYDLATPYFAAKYTLYHMNLDPSLKKQIHEGYYSAGHMMYIDVNELAKLRSDVRAFINEALKKNTTAPTTQQ